MIKTKTLENLWFRRLWQQSKLFLRLDSLDLFLWYNEENKSFYLLDNEIDSIYKTNIKTLSQLKTIIKLLKTY